jgi:phosphatidylglycerol---prolipoprotein diacylglyceryl transferase
MTFLADSYFHTLDPFLIEFPRHWPVAGIRWYGLAYAVGFLCGWAMVHWVAGRPWSPIPKNKVGDLMFAVILGVLLGGRLGYALFYEPHLFISTSSSAPYWNLLAINKGGMASHGGMIGVIIAVTVFARRHKITALHILDIGSMACTPGLFFGRIANFINGELHGRAVPDQTNPPSWSMKFPQEMYDWLPAEVNGAWVASPEKLQALTDIAVNVSIPSIDSATGHEVRISVQADRWLTSLELYISNPADPPDSAVHYVNAVLAQIIHAAQAGNQVVVEGLRPVLTAFYPSQLLQAFTDGPVLLTCLVLIWLKPRKPGVVGSWFLIIYGILRILTEFFREPDQGVSLMLGLSRGQLLSLLMTVVGIVCLRIATQRAAPKLGGLFDRSATQTKEA